MKSYRVTVKAEINTSELSSPRQAAGIVAVKLEAPSIQVKTIRASKLDKGKTEEIVIRPAQELAEDGRCHA